MPEVFPFKALIARPDILPDFTASARDSEIQVAKKHLERIPETHFLRILFPQLFHPEINEDEHDSHEDGHNQALDEYIARDILLPDAADAFYIYRQTKKGRTFTGMIALASIESYKQGLIKKHELTQVKKESQIADYFRHIRVNGSPVLLTYPDSPAINATIHDLTLLPVTFRFSTEDEVLHELWRVSDANYIKYYRSEFGKVPAFYIADGHHRCASYAHLSDELEGFMAYLLPSSQLEIRAFHRLIRQSSLGTEELIPGAAASFCSGGDTSGYGASGGGSYLSGYARSLVLPADSSKAADN